MIQKFCARRLLPEAFIDTSPVLAKISKRRLRAQPFARLSTSPITPKRPLPFTGVHVLTFLPYVYRASISFSLKVSIFLLRKPGIWQTRR